MVAPTTEPDEPSLTERVAARAAELSSTERRIADYLAEHPEEVAFASAEQLAAAIGTSDASVVRTVKRLGYSGLPGLRLSLRAQVEAMLTPAGRLHNSLATLDHAGGSIVHTVFQDQIALLQQASRTLRAEQFDRAVELIVAGDTTLVCGIGTLGDLAEYLRLKLVRLGRSARTARASGFLLADDLIGLQPDDVVILMVHSAVGPEGMTILEHARQVGARVVLITDALGEALADWVDVVMSAPMGRPGMFSGYTSTLVLLEAVVFAVAHAETDKSLAQMAQLNRLRERLAGTKVGGMGVLRSAAVAAPPASRRRRSARSPGTGPDGA